jgi:predicted outer membrane repeat protein
MCARNWRLLPAAALAWLWLVLLAAPLHAAGVVGNGTPGSCTDAAYAAAFDGGGAVTFDCGPNPVTIIVNTQVITGSTTVDGGGLVTLDGEDLRQLFLVLDGGSLAVRAITLAHGNFGDGGAAFVAQGGTLRLDTVTVRDSTADGSDSDGGAVQNRGTLIVASSTFLRNHADDGGGAINNNGGTVTIRSSTFISNTALNGGALNNAAGSLDIRAALVYSNSVGNQGGGLFATAGTITVTNVTIAGNRAFRGGGIYGQNNAVISVLNSTVYTNTASSAAGGIWNNTAGAGANVVLKNTIVAANNDPISGVLNCDGPAMRTLGHNLIGDGTCITPISGDLPNTDPQLGPLAANGGLTRNYAPLAGSPAIDAGDNSGCPAVDQRGYPRPINITCDIGAVEAGSGLWLPLLRKG